MQGRDERNVSRSSSVERDYSIKSKVSKIDKDQKSGHSRRRSRSTEVRRDSRNYDRRADDESRNYDRMREDKHRNRKRSHSEERHRHQRNRSLSVENKKKKIDRSENRARHSRDRDTDKNKGKPSDNEKDEVNDNEINDYWATKMAKTNLKSASNENVLSKTGGAYIPPARLRMMQEKISDKNSIQYQRIAWEALKKSIHGLINKVTASNITEICNELFQENIVRGRGLLVKSVILAQSLSLTFSHVFAALIAVVNSKFPQVGVLLLNRLVLQFKRGFKRNIKTLCLSSTRFIAHLYNQKVVDEILPFEILILLLERPTNDSVEVAIGLLKECGRKLTDDSASATMSIFDSLKNILHEASIDKRVTYMIEVMFAIRKDGYKDFPSVLPDLEMIEDDDQFMHRITLEDEITSEDRLNVFEFDPEFEENEKKYETIKNELFGEGGDDDDDDEGDDDSEDEEDEASGQEAEEGSNKEIIIDKTETNLIALRRTIYLTIQSSLDYEECAHKLLKMQLKPGQEYELCNMIMDCSAQERTYIAFYGLLAQRFCNIDNKYVEPYEKIFQEQYDTAHRLETNKLRNVSKFFAHLLHSDAISWEVLQCIKLNEDDTTSSSRIFIKILFQELSEYMGLAKLNQRLKDPTLQTSFQEIFPKVNPRDTRFAINFFTSIGLGGLTDELRDHLKTVAATQRAAPRTRTMSSSSSSSSSSTSS